MSITEGNDEIILGNVPLAKKIDGQYYYYIYNAHGDVVMIVDESGNVQNTYEYDAWGVVTNQTESINNSHKYAGEYYDTETGLIYLRARYYDPSDRRFTQEDPARDERNWYAYCYNNPIMFLDKNGLAPRPYQPGLWNNAKIQPITNCYAYALDFIGEVSYGNKKGTSLPIGDFGLQPGDLRSNMPTLLQELWKGAEFQSMQRYSLAGSLLDAIGNNHIFRPATSDNISGKNLGENEWTVYLVATSDWSDYHWYRQNADENGNFDGTWSHKPGSSPVTNKELLEVIYNNVVINGNTISSDEPICRYGSIITDPTQISRTTIFSYYGTSGELLYQSSLTYDKVVGAFVVGY